MASSLMLPVSLLDEAAELLLSEDGSLLANEIGIPEEGVDPFHLSQSENPPSQLTQLLANTLGTWTEARHYILPPGPDTLTAVTAASAFNPGFYGSHWQRFVNAFALELELLSDTIDQNLHSRQLEYPGYTHDDALDHASRLVLPSRSTSVLAVSANDGAKYTDALVDAGGNRVLDPNRGIDLALLEATRIFDFYYGLAQRVDFIATGNLTTYTLPSRVGQNPDGGLQIEWITADDSEISTYTLAPDRKTLTVAASAGANIVVHYTCYDVYFVLQEDLPVLYLRSNYYEVFVRSSGPPPVSLGGINGLGPDVAVLQPNPHLIWNELDEIGLLLSKPRSAGERNAVYQRRLVDATLYPQDSTTTGLRNALATELGLVHHLLWGPLPFPSLRTDVPAATAGGGFNVALGNGNVYTDSILIDRLPLSYFSIVTTDTDQTSPITVSVPALAPGVTFTQAIQMASLSGPVIPGLVPLRLTLNIPASAQGAYDQIEIKGTKRQIFQAPVRPWFAGSLQVWLNGNALVSGIDFTELSTTSFAVNIPTVPSDLLQLGYVYNDSDAVPELEALADIETDLAPILRVSASYQNDAVSVGSASFTGFHDQPFKADPQLIPTGGTWTLTINVLNAGSYTSDPASYTVHLPPAISWDGHVLARHTLPTKLREIRYIDGDELWVQGLTDTALRQRLYDVRGGATPLLKAFAQEIAAVSPLQWGEVHWDRSFWRSAKEPTSEFGFLPNLFDPQYQSVLTPRAILASGVLSVLSDPGAEANLVGEQVDQLIVGTDSHGQTYLLDVSQPGTGVGPALTVRYPDFRSGIGDGDDCLLSVAKRADVLAATAGAYPVQMQLSRSPVPLSSYTTTPAASALDAWWATLRPGHYFLNQEERYHFAHPVYAETTTVQTFLPGATSHIPLTAQAIDPVAGLSPLRRTFFLDTLDRLTLTYTETLAVSGNSLYATYADLHSIVFISASDGHTYTLPTSTSDNRILLPSATTGSITVSYQLNGSYMVLDDVQAGGAWLVMDQPSDRGVLITYEGGAGQALTGIPLHPYYTPRSQGFIYLAENYTIPATLRVQARPGQVPADGITSFTVVVYVADKHGAGLPNFPVSLLIGYVGGAVTWTGRTDEFGYAYATITAPSQPQLATITSTIQLFDQNANPLDSLQDQTVVECFASFS